MLHVGIFRVIFIDHRPLPGFPINILDEIELLMSPEKNAIFIKRNLAGLIQAIQKDTRLVINTIVVGILVN